MADKLDYPDYDDDGRDEYVSSSRKQSQTQQSSRKVEPVSTPVEKSNVKPKSVAPLVDDSDDDDEDKARIAQMLYSAFAIGKTVFKNARGFAGVGWGYVFIAASAVVLWSVGVFRSLSKFFHKRKKDDTSNVTKTDVKSDSQSKKPIFTNPFKRKQATSSVKQAAAPKSAKQAPIVDDDEDTPNVWRSRLIVGGAAVAAVLVLTGCGYLLFSVFSGGNDATEIAAVDSKKIEEIDESDVPGAGLTFHEPQPFTSDIDETPFTAAPTTNSQNDAVVSSPFGAPLPPVEVEEVPPAPPIANAFTTNPFAETITTNVPSAETPFGAVAENNSFTDTQTDVNEDVPVAANTTDNTNGNEVVDLSEPELPASNASAFAPIPETASQSSPQNALTLTTPSNAPTTPETQNIVAIPDNVPPVEERLPSFPAEPVIPAVAQISEPMTPMTTSSSQQTTQPIPRATAASPMVITTPPAEITAPMVSLLSSVPVTAKVLPPSNPVIPTDSLRAATVQPPVAQEFIPNENTPLLPKDPSLTAEQSLTEKPPVAQIPIAQTPVTQPPVPFEPPPVALRSVPPVASLLTPSENLPSVPGDPIPTTAVPPTEQNSAITALAQTSPTSSNTATFTQPSIAASSPVAEAEAALSRTLPPEPSTDTLIASQPTGTITPTISSLTALLPNQTNPVTQPTYQRADIAPRYESAYTGVATQPLSATNNTPRIGEMYTVPAGETYWTICEKVYGTGRLYQALAQHNRSIVSDPRQLQGATIEIPLREVLERYAVATVPNAGAAQLSSYGSVNASRATTSQPNTSVSANWASSFLSASNNAPVANRQQNVIIYIVQEGDDLFSIAQNKLGSVAKYAEIYEMNRDKIDTTNNSIRPGTELILPTSGIYRGTQRR